jgi:N-acetylneuraminic acid mutarotase
MTGSIREGCWCAAICAPLLALATACGDEVLVTEVVEQIYVEEEGTNAWVNKEPMPTGRQGLAAAAAGNKVYAIGGWTGSGSTGAVEEYDPATDTWTPVAGLPTPRNRLAAGAVNGKIYVVGGTSGPSQSPVIHATLEEYDPATDTWNPKADMPTARRSLAVAVLNGLLYAIGGNDGSGSVPTVEAYDPVTDTWSPRASMSEDRALLSAAAVGGRIFALGGSRQTANTSQDLSDNEEYDPATDTWTARTRVPVDMAGQAAVPIAGRLYIIGGNDGDENRCEQYNPDTDAFWRRDDMLTGRWDPAAAVVGGRVYVLGGSGGYDKNEEFTP